MIRFVNSDGEEKFRIADNGEMEFSTKEERIAYEKSLIQPEGEDTKNGGSNS